MPRSRALLQDASRANGWACTATRRTILSTRRRRHERQIACRYRRRLEGGTTARARRRQGRRRLDGTQCRSSSRGTPTRCCGCASAASRPRARARCMGRRGMSGVWEVTVQDLAHGRGVDWSAASSSPSSWRDRQDVGVQRAHRLHAVRRLRPERGAWWAVATHPSQHLPARLQRHRRRDLEANTRENGFKCHRHAVTADGFGVVTFASGPSSPAMPRQRRVGRSGRAATAPAAARRRRSSLAAVDLRRRRHRRRHLHNVALTRRGLTTRRLEEPRHDLLEAVPATRRRRR